MVDDEENLRHLLRVILERNGFGVIEARDGVEALAVLTERDDVRVVLCDIRMPRMDGMALLDRLREMGRASPRGPVRVVMMSAYGSTDTAVEALSRGAYDYVSKPFRADEIRACLERIVERDRLEAENRRLQEKIRERSAVGGFIGRSEAARAVMDLVRKVAAYPTTVLITGESGTGKELVARALHDLSERADGPFLPVNCAALPESLLESELFGHERGAFTGAVKPHAGLFEQASGGTLMLDEIGDMPLELQSRLLRVIEDGRVRRVGGSRDIPVDVRVVAATARDLTLDARQGRFREDLYYRLNVVRVRIPPLRERREDIPLLAEALVERAARRLGRAVPEISGDALRALLAFRWPGNVRQLENALEHALLMVADDHGRIELDHLPPEIRGEAAHLPIEIQGEDLSIKRHTARLEQALIRRALERTGGNRTQAARLLDLSYKALLYKIRDYGIEP